MIPNLITAEQRAQLLANGQAYTAGHAGDPLPVVRLFTPDAMRPGYRPRSTRSIVTPPTVCATKVSACPIWAM